MMDWRIVVVNGTLLALVLLSRKPLWWLPCVSLAMLLLSVPARRKVHAVDWHTWHPVLATLLATPLNARLSRWVRYRKIIGGDSLMSVPTQKGMALVLLDLSKNDVDTLLHFVWVRGVLAALHGCPKGMLLRVLERLRQHSDRVEVTYIFGLLNDAEAEWHSAGCFGLAWDNGMTLQTKVLPTLGKAFWRTRKRWGTWWVATDSIAPHLSAFVQSFGKDGSPDPFVRSLPHDDDLTVAWFSPVLKLKPSKA